MPGLNFQVEFSRKRKNSITPKISELAQICLPKLTESVWREAGGKIRKVKEAFVGRKTSVLAQLFSFYWEVILFFVPPRLFFSLTAWVFYSTDHAEKNMIMQSAAWFATKPCLLGSWWRNQEYATRTKEFSELISSNCLESPPYSNRSGNFNLTHLFGEAFNVEKLELQHLLEVIWILLWVSQRSLSPKCADIAKNDLVLSDFETLLNYRTPPE